MLARPPRSTRYDQLAPQRIVDLATENRKRGARLERGRDASGTPQLIAIFPTPLAGDPEQVIDLGFLLSLPHLSNPLAEAWFETTRTHAANTRLVGSRYLRNGFASYLHQTNQASIELSDISTTLINSFIDWLNQESGGKARWGHGTRDELLGAIRAAVAYLRQTEPWSRKIRSDLYIRERVWPAPSRRSKPTESLTPDALRYLYLACVDEASRTMREHAAAQHAVFVAESREVVSSDHGEDFSDLGVCLRWLTKRYEGVVPEWAELTKESRRFTRAAWNCHRGIGNITKYLYPPPRLLVPFVVLLGLAFRYNSNALLESNTEDYERFQLLGHERIRGRAYKGRAGRQQFASVSVEDRDDNPAVLIDFLERWTARIRPLAPPRFADRLFLFVPANKTKAVKSYEHALGGSSDETWKHNIRAFCADHGLQPLALKQLRTTVLDLADELFAGDLRARQIAGQHRDPQTSYTHYSSDAVRQRNAERLGNIMILRGRWRGTDGKIDPRERSETSDLGAATPGWNCLDPYSSPFEREGILCGAYGRCPACPLASIDLNSPYACAQVHNLLDATRAAQKTMAPQAWLERVAPVESRLTNFWLPQFTESTRDAARQLDLPALPPLE